MKCIIVDDNIYETELLSYLIQKEPRLELIRGFNNPLEAIEYIKQTEPELIFLDIHMPVVLGIDLYSQIKSYNPICVFVSAHGEYAIDSYNVQAFDFLLKPVMPERFEACVNRIFEYQSVRKRADLFNAQIEAKTIFIKEGSTQFSINEDEILYIEALSDYSKIYTAKRNYLTLSKLKHFIEQLSGEKFVRIHRSYAIAKRHIASKNANCITIAGYDIPIGKTFRNAVRENLA